MDNFNKAKNPAQGISAEQNNLQTEDNLTKSGQATAEAAEAEKKEAAAELGKFKNVETLLKAYSELEAEFTRRSQRLRELEKESKAKAVPDGEAAAPSSDAEEELIKNALSNEKVRDAVIGDYLKGVLKDTPPLTLGGGGVQAPRITPKSVKEAGKLARNFLNK